MRNTHGTYLIVGNDGNCKGITYEPVVFFIKYCYIMLLWDNSIWKQYNTHYTLTLSNIKTKIFSWVGEENKGKNVLNFFV